MTDPEDTDPAEGSRETVDKELRRQKGSDPQQSDQEKTPNDLGPGSEP